MLRRIGQAGVVIVFSAALTAAQTSTGTSELRIAGAVSTPLSLTVRDLKNMPRTSLRVTNAHDKKEETYEGVLLEVLLQKAGAPHREQLRGQLMTSYVVAEAQDSYRVVFALAELDSGFLDSQVLVAGTMDGAARCEARPLPPGCATRKTSGAMLRTITVVTAEH